VSSLIVGYFHPYTQVFSIVRCETTHGKHPLQHPSNEWFLFGGDTRLDRGGLKKVTHKSMEKSFREAMSSSTKRMTRLVYHNSVVVVAVSIFRVQLHGWWGKEPQLILLWKTRNIICQLEIAEGKKTPCSGVNAFRCAYVYVAAASEGALLQWSRKYWPFKNFLLVSDVLLDYYTSDQIPTLWAQVVSDIKSDCVRWFGSCRSVWVRTTYFAKWCSNRFRASWVARSLRHSFASVAKYYVLCVPEV